MASIKVHLKDGRILDYPHEGRPGGSYTKSVSYDGAFVVVEDEWGKTVAWPAADVDHVETTPHRW